MPVTKGKAAVSNVANNNAANVADSATNNAAIDSAVKVKKPASRAKTKPAAKTKTASVKAKTNDCDPCDTLAATFERQFHSALCRDELAVNDMYSALASTVKSQLLPQWRETRVKDNQYQQKQVAYLSLEFLMGRTLGNALLSLDLTEETNKALTDYSAQLETLQEAELDAGLGNGGLGRLAACFLDSCASLDLSVVGYGIRYEYGMFKQKLVRWLSSRAT